jgi:glycosyltransferase involved in cell wall biosynthesis
MLVLITDAWHPQVNGVVTTYTNILKHFTIPYEVISPSNFISIYNPFYPEIRLAVPIGLRKKLLSYKNAMFHIATEGPLGWAARNILSMQGIKYTTAFHTNFAEYLNIHFKIPVSWTRPYIDLFHCTANKIFVPSKEIADSFPACSTVLLSRGYDSTFFYDSKFSTRSTILYVGRCSKEKNVEAFCELPYENLVIIGDGPQRKKLERKYKNVQFLGYKFGFELGESYRRARVTVFPSKTDTFGITILEAMACGSPVASFNTSAAKNLIVNEVNGYRNDNLAFAVKQCLSMNPKVVAKSVAEYSWEKVAYVFSNNLAI